MSLERYQPSNGTAGEGFICDWCGRCARSDHNSPGADGDTLFGCAITGDTMLYAVDDPQYPEEWVWDGEEPKCTAFVQEGEPLATARCAQTPDMFQQDGVA